jgi:hypothetical protein
LLTWEGGDLVGHQWTVAGVFHLLTTPTVTSLFGAGSAGTAVRLPFCMFESGPTSTNTGLRLFNESGTLAVDSSSPVQRALLVGGRAARIRLRIGGNEVGCNNETRDFTPNHASRAAAVFLDGDIAAADRWNRAPFEGEASQHPRPDYSFVQNHGRLTVR